MARAFQIIFALSLLSLALFMNEAAARVMLFQGQTLNAPQFIQNDRHTFIMQNDCNLVLYSSGKPIWASGTWGKGPGCKVTLQNDGNLALFTQSGANVWNSNSHRDPGLYQLVVQDDGNVVIYGTSSGAIWATNTNGQSEAIGMPFMHAPEVTLSSLLL